MPGFHKRQRSPVSKMTMPWLLRLITRSENSCSCRSRRWARWVSRMPFKEPPREHGGAEQDAHHRRDALEQNLKIVLPRLRCLLAADRDGSVRRIPEDSRGLHGRVVQGSSVVVGQAGRETRLRLAPEQVLLLDRRGKSERLHLPHERLRRRAPADSP